jgi:hypothetical protein
LLTPLTSLFLVFTGRRRGAHFRLSLLCQRLATPMILPLHHDFAKRQTSPVPTVRATTVATEAATAHSLAFDPSATVVTASTVPPPVTPAIATSSKPAAPSTNSASSAGSVHVIPLGTVIGVCLGTFAISALLVFLGLWIYRRSARPRPRHPVSPYTQKRNAPPTRSRSARQPWVQLGDEKVHRDQWEETFPRTAQAEQVEEVGAMEKLTMFTKPPASTHSMDKTSESNRFDEGEAFTHYHPGLAAQLVSGNGTGTTRQDSSQRQFLDVDVGAPAFRTPIYGQSPYMPFGSSDIQSSSSTTLPSNAIRAIPTPPVTSHGEPHKWESAEIVNVDGTSAQETNPFGDDISETRTSLSNPSFKGQDPKLSKGKARARSPSSPRSGWAHSRSRSSERLDPFRDSRADSQAESPSRAMKSLIAALEPAVEDVREQPTHQSAAQLSFLPAAERASRNATSMLSGTQEDPTNASTSFPIPPMGIPESLRY